MSLVAAPGIANYRLSNMKRNSYFCLGTGTLSFFYSFLPSFIHSLLLWHLSLSEWAESCVSALIGSSGSNQHPTLPTSFNHQKLFYWYWARKTSRKFQSMRGLKIKAQFSISASFDLGYGIMRADKIPPPPPRNPPAPPKRIMGK